MPPPKAKAASPPKAGSIAAKLRAFREGSGGESPPPAVATGPSLKPVAVTGRQERRMDVNTQRFEDASNRVTSGDTPDVTSGSRGEGGGCDESSEDEEEEVAPRGEERAVPSLKPVPMSGQQARHIAEERERLDAAVARAGPSLMPVPMSAQQARHIQEGKDRLDAAAARAAQQASPGGRGSGGGPTPGGGLGGRGGGMAERGAGRGRFSMPDEEEEDSEDSDEEELTSQRSTLKNRSRLVSNEEEEAQKRRDEAQAWREKREEEDRAERGQKEAEKSEKRKTEDAAAAQQAEQGRVKQERERARAAEALEREEEEALAARRAALDAARNRPAPVTVSDRQAPGGPGLVAGPESAGGADAGAGGGGEGEEEGRVAPRATAKAHARLPASPPVALPPMAMLPAAWGAAMVGPSASLRDLQACVILLPASRIALCARVLQWMLHPGALAAAAEGGGVEDREAMGLPGLTGEANPAMPEGAFEFQVIGVCRAVLPFSSCPASLRPAGAKDASDPLLLLAVGAHTPRSAPGAAGGDEYASKVRKAISAVLLADLPELGGGACGDPEGAVLTGGEGSLLEAGAVISAGSEVGQGLPSPLLWFVCAPEAVDGGDAEAIDGSAGADTVVSVLRPEAIQRGAVGQVLARLDAERLDLCGLRMVFPSKAHLDRLRSFATVPSGPSTPLLVLAARGFEAGRIWGLAVGPEDPLVARRTDPDSLRAKFGVDRARNLLTSARTVERNRREACWWFSLGHDMVVEDTHPAASLPPIRLLNTYPVETAAVVLRAGLPAHLVAAGLLLTAMRRAPLEPRAVDSAGLPPWVCAKGVSPPPVCSLWRGENAVARTQALEREITAVLTKCGGLPGPEEIGEAPPPPRTPPRRATGPPPFISQADILCVAGSEADSLRCAMHLAVNEGAEPVGGVAFAQRVADAPSRLSSTPELPQVACVVVTPDCVSDPIAVRALLEKLFSKGPKGLGADLLGCKLLSWLPDHASRELCPVPKLLSWLPPHASRELCPVPKGNVQRDESLEALESGPVLAFAVRLPDAFTRLAALLGPLPDSPEAVLARNSYA
ncbi:hypothetical protein T484DRAFT_1808192, partial [Baffinella frigidus]